MTTEGAYAGVDRRRVTGLPPAAPADKTRDSRPLLVCREPCVACLAGQLSHNPFSVLATGGRNDRRQGLLASRWTLPHRRLISGPPKRNGSQLKRVDF